VVSLVVEDDDIALGPQGPTYPPDHLVGGLLEPVRVAVGAGEDLLRERRRLEGLAPDEAVEVRDLDLRRLQGVELIRREQVTLGVVVAREVRAQDLEAVADRDPGSDDKERVAEALVLGVGQLVERCQAMSMAITTVLPEPVAILNAIR